MTEEVKVAANVVTSENLAEFNAKRLGLADREAVVEATPTEPQEQSEPVEAKEEATATEDRKQNPKLEKRFSEITKQREAAREEARKEREAREALEVRLKEVESRSAPQEAPKADSGEPQPNQFTDMYEYAKALTDYQVEKRMSEIETRKQAEQQQNEKKQVIDSFVKRVEAAKASLPDFDEMVGSADVTVSNEVRDAIWESDVGPQILYHLAENPDVAEKLKSMSVAAANRFIGKLEAQFEPQTKPVVGKSKAPAPINPIRSAANGRDVSLITDNQFQGTYQQWKSARLAGRIR
jgi:hypothetical protein